MSVYQKYASISDENQFDWRAHFCRLNAAPFMKYKTLHFFSSDSSCKHLFLFIFLSLKMTHITFVGLWKYFPHIIFQMCKHCKSACWEFLLTGEFYFFFLFFCSVQTYKTLQIQLFQMKRMKFYCTKYEIQSE